MAIAEDKLQEWIEKTRHVAQNVEKSEDLSAMDVLNALANAIPHLRQEKPIFADMELQQLFDEAENIGSDIDAAIERAKSAIADSRQKVERVAEQTLERFQPLL